MQDPAPVGAARGPRPLRRDAERNRQRMLAAARQVFAERGLTATLDDVAHHAGLGVGTVYRRFPNKESLLEALFEQRLDEVVDLATGALDRDDPWEALVFVLTGLCERFTADRGLRDVMLSTSPHRIRISEARQRIAPPIGELIHRAQQAGRLRPEIRVEDIPMLAMMVTSIAQYTGPVHPDLWRRYLAITLDGLAARSPGTELPPALRPGQLEEVMRAWHTRRP